MPAWARILTATSCVTRAVSVGQVFIEHLLHVRLMLGVSSQDSYPATPSGSL